MNLSSFDQRETESNLWLCEHIEPHMPDSSTAVILNCGYNIFGFMLLTRNTDKIRSLTGIDSSPDQVKIANKILDMWTIENRAIKNVSFDPSVLNYEVFDTVICLDCGRIDNTEWFDRIPDGTLVCIQDSVDSTQTLDYFFNRYPLTTTYSLETIADRHIHIGVK